MRLPYTEFFATYEVVAPFRIPAHPGSLWRGVIGRILRREGCARQTVCQDSCQLPSACLYQKLFDPPMPQPAPHRFLRGQKEAPPPLVPIVAWSGSQQLLVGDSVRIGLRCLGVLSESEKECLVRVLAAVSQARLGRDEGRVELVAVSVPVSDEKTPRSPTVPSRSRPSPASPVTARRSPSRAPTRRSTRSAHASAPGAPA